MGWRQVAQAELPTLAPETRQYLQAYADGVNVYLQGRSPSDVSLEYTLLGVQLPEYTIEDWTPVDSLAWLIAMAWDLKGNYADELARARLAGRMSLSQIDQIYPAYPFDVHAPILSRQDWRPGSAGPAASAGSATAAVPATLRSPAAERAYAAVSTALEQVPQLVGRGDGVGSNSWVVSGAKTTTGKPLLANDPHLGVGIPGIWYQIGLHCTTVSSVCPLDVAGYSFSGVPGVVIGHNQSIAWGFTNLGPDVSDFYLERVVGDTYQRDGQWLPLQTRQETIKVRGGDPETITVRSTVHGPLLSDVLSEVSDAGASAPTANKEDSGAYAVSLEWTGLIPNRTADAILAMDTAQNFEEFRAAARSFTVPAQNLVYADVQGHIAYQAPGQVPIRRPALPDTPPGYWPAPGWDSAYDWRGFVPFGQLPWTLDPPEGFIVTANQAVTDEQAPFLTTEWDYGFRSQRIRQRLDALQKVSPSDMANIQLDTRNLAAETLVSAFLSVKITDVDSSGEAAFTKEAQDLLRGWNYANPASDSRNSAAAAYYNAVWSNLLRLLFDDELPADLQADGGDRWMQAVIKLLDEPKSSWWDNKQTPDITEGKDEIIRQALIAARLELTRELGKDPAGWQWGKLHQLTLRSSVMGGDSLSGIQGTLLRKLFNRGGYQMPGGSSIVDANGWNASEGYSVDWAPSMRMVVDLSDLDASTWVNQTGASGHVMSAHYDDQIDAWVKGTQYPWPFSERAVRAAARDTLTLVPSSSG
jgi:penicillin amidase